MGSGGYGWMGLWPESLSGGYSANSLVKSLGWVTVTIPSVLCERLRPRKRNLVVLAYVGNNHLR